MSTIIKTNFKPRARLLIQLGEKLIKSENIAVLELVKNSYDADSKNVTITFKNIDDKKNGEIIILDDGFGMTDDVIKNVWLEPGADFKDLLLKNGNQFSMGFEYDSPTRVPIGEKGVGRFGVHKLGDSIELVTKSKLSQNEIVVKIDWRIFEEERYMEDAKFEIEYRSPTIFTGEKTGTQIKVTNIRKNWDKKTFKQLARSINSLNSPFNKKDNFTVEIKLDLEDKPECLEWIDEIIPISKIKEKSLWYLSAEIEGGNITKFDYKFRPYSSMTKINDRILSISDLKVSKDGKVKLDDDIDLNKHKIGKVVFNAYLFDLSPKILKLGIENPKSINNYLNDNGGVRVYREGLRIYDYGEQGNDWLDLNKKRINDPSKKIGNRNILGFVELERSESQDLIEKTNREGFNENQAYKDFQSALLQLISMFVNQRNSDKELIRVKYEETIKNIPVNHELDKLKHTVEENFKEDSIIGDKKNKLRNKILSSIDRVKSQYETVNNTLLKSAGAGLSLGVGLHEVEKRVKELHKGLQNKDIQDLEKIFNSVHDILNLIEGFGNMLTSTKKVSISVKEILKRGIFNTEYRLKAHNITLSQNFLNNNEDVSINCIENIVIGILINIIDNSIYWLHKYEIEDKKILIDSIKYSDGNIGVIIADNGKGFGIDPENAIKPYVTGKNSGGMGLGLYIADEMMKSLSGSLNIRDYSELSHKIDKEYKNGAIIELIFPKK